MSVFRKLCVLNLKSVFGLKDIDFFTVDPSWNPASDAQAVDRSDDVLIVTIIHQILRFSANPESSDPLNMVTST